MKAIEIYGRRCSPDHDDLVAQSRGVLTDAAERFTPLVQATSLGIEDMVITDLICALELPIAFAMLDTGELPPETLALKERLETHYGRTIKVYRPDAAKVARFTAEHGSRPMYESVELRHACCGLRKLEPLAELLAGQAGWITGLRREQSGFRSHVSFVEEDGPERVKVNPLANWTFGDVWQYAERHGVPYNPLHDAFYPSIGCAPCTRSVTPGEDFRSGRWWWENEGARECGLHAHEDQARPVPATAAHR